MDEIIYYKRMAIKFSKMAMAATAANDWHRFDLFNQEMCAYMDMLNKRM